MHCIHISICVLTPVSSSFYSSLSSVLHLPALWLFPLPECPALSVSAIEDWSSHSVTSDIVPLQINDQQPAECHWRSGLNNAGRGRGILCSQDRKGRCVMWLWTDYSTHILPAKDRRASIARWTQVWILTGMYCVICGALGVTRDIKYTVQFGKCTYFLLIYDKYAAKVAG